jgi:hypothetical protein
VTRFFNTAGPCNPQYHYMLPAEERLPEARPLVAQMGYFVVHAPRQTGKTTILRALAKALTAEGNFAAVQFSCETAKIAEDDVDWAERLLLEEIRTAAERLPPELHPPAWPEATPGLRLKSALAAWAEACPRPLVLFFDEIDALLGRSLLSVLSQLRAGFPDRPSRAPWSVALCGLRDVRDYKAASGGAEPRLGSSSPFNVKIRSLRVGNFDEDEVRRLYGQHTAETGQPFTDEAVHHAWALTEGQPWLINALAQAVVQEIGVPRDEPITAAHVDAARDRLVLARQTHLDSLAARLAEPRVRRVVEPLIAGDVPAADPYDDDFQYVADLGLVAPDMPVRIANPIYREVVVRVLASTAERAVTAEPRSFVLPDGRFDVERMLGEFADFWRQHGDVLSQRLNDHEVAPQLVLMAFLQRVVNGGGQIEREYGVGRGRIDLLLRWPYTDGGGRRAWQRHAFELKVWSDGRPDPLAEGLSQLDAYLDRLGLDTGVLVVFDRRPDAAPITERTRFERATSARGRAVTLLRA